jgi:hypothetical protein
MKKATNPLALDLRAGGFDGHVLVFGRSLGLSSQTFVMQFKNLPIAHLGYFRTDFKTGRPYALFLIRDPVLAVYQALRKLFIG